MIFVGELIKSQSPSLFGNSPAYFGPPSFVDGKYIYLLKSKVFISDNILVYLSNVNKSVLIIIIKSYS